jgi:hypothetical protein
MTMTSDLTTINPAGLIGHELVEGWKRELDSCYDANGEYDERFLDYVLGEIEYDQRCVEQEADILAVFAEESGRFA